MVVRADSSTACVARLRNSRVSRRLSRSAYSFTHMSMGTPAPFERHWNLAGHRGGGFLSRIFPVVTGSFAGKPGL